MTDKARKTKKQIDITPKEVILLRPARNVLEVKGFWSYVLCAMRGDCDLACVICLTECASQDVLMILSKWRVIQILYFQSERLIQR